MDAHFATAQSSPPTAASVAVLLSGTMRGFREGCIASLREHVVQPNAAVDPTWLQGQCRTLFAVAGL